MRPSTPEMMRTDPCIDELLGNPCTDPELPNKVFIGCLPAMNRILDFIPEIFWPNLRGISRPMKNLVEQRLANLQKLSYPEVYPGQRFLSRFIEDNNTWIVRKDLERFFSEYAPNLTEMPGGLRHYFPSDFGPYNHTTGQKKAHSDFHNFMKLTMTGDRQYYFGSDPLFKKSFQENFPFMLQELNLASVKLRDTCLFNHENFLRLPTLETIIFPIEMYSGFESDFKYVTECPKLREVTLPFIVYSPEHCRNRLQPSKTLSSLKIQCCPDGLPNNYWDDLLSESPSLRRIEKTSPAYVSPEFYVQLSKAPKLTELELQLRAPSGQGGVRDAEERAEHAAVLNMLGHQSLQSLTALNLSCLLSWHDRFFMIINQNLPNLSELELSFLEHGQDFQIMDERDLRGYLDLPIEELHISYSVYTNFHPDVIQIELRSGPNLRKSLKEVKVDVVYEALDSFQNDISIVKHKIFVEDFLKDCNHLKKLHFTDANIREDFRQTLAELMENGLPELEDIRIKDREEEEDSDDEYVPHFEDYDAYVDYYYEQQGHE